MPVCRKNTLEANWYDYPRYYDIAFQSETKKEADFIEAACQKYSPLKIRRMLEPACGTGRLIVELARRGYEMTGIDLNEQAIGFLNRRLLRRGLGAKILKADITDFRLPFKVDVAFCTVNSFRHILTEQGARQHLKCIADSLRKGGLYILGLHLMPPDVDPDSLERWTERQGNTQVTVTLRTLDFDLRRRIEKLRVSMLIREKGRVIRIRDEFCFRLYNVQQIRRLLASVPEFELCGVYDFWYEIDEPRKLDNEIADTVLVLRKR